HFGSFRVQVNVDEGAAQLGFGHREGGDLVERRLRQRLEAERTFGRNRIGAVAVHAVGALAPAQRYQRVAALRYAGDASGNGVVALAHEADFNAGDIAAGDGFHGSGAFGGRGGRVVGLAINSFGAAVGADFGHTDHTNVGRRSFQTELARSAADA